MIGGLGAIGVILAAINSVLLLFTSLLVLWCRVATNLQARYAGTDLANSRQRATSISMTMVFTTFGAVAGPNLVNVMGDFALSIGVPSLAGPFILAGLVLFIMLRPDPLVLARMIEATNLEPSDKGHLAANEQSENKKGIIIGATIMVLTQIVMVAIMTMTPVHMIKKLLNNMTRLLNCIMQIVLEENRIVHGLKQQLEVLHVFLDPL